MMQYFTEQGETHAEVKEKIREKYGEKAVILTWKEIPRRYKFFFFRTCVEYSGYIPGNVIASKKATPKKDEESRQKILASVGGVKKEEKPNEDFQKIKEDLKQIRVHLLSQESEPASHETLRRLKDVMVENEFSLAFIAKTMDFLKGEFNLKDLENWDLVTEAVAYWISHSIKIYEDPIVAKKPRKFILVGPTGVGKTTTIAKLAATYGIINKSSLQKVRIITIDTYRIGAQKQIETYGEIMKIPVSSVEHWEDMRGLIALSSDYDLVFIDTIGKNQKDSLKLKEMKQLLEFCGSDSEIHLAVSATTKTADIRNIMTSFEIFNYSSVLITKWDETTRVGNLISLLDEKQKAVSFVTTGQSVPQDIEKATSLRFIQGLQGFDLNMKKIEKKISS